MPLVHPIDPLILPGGVPMSFQVIPPVPVQEEALRTGQPLSFLMGSRGENNSEEPRHRVIIPHPFYLGATPVTQAQFAVWTATTDYADWFAANRDKVDENSPHKNGFDGKPEHPAENLSCYEAEAFCRWLHDAALLPKGYHACLPNEAQWEYACRAGTATEYHSGDGVAALQEVGWFDENSGRETRPVGLKPPNGWGLHDMHGNVWEWCKDAYDSEAYSKRADSWCAEPWPATDEDPLRVLRGGSYVISAWGCRAAYRYWGWPRDRYGIQGFRLCVSPGPVVEPKTAGSGAGAGREGRPKGGGGADFAALKLPQRPA